MDMRLVSIMLVFGAMALLNGSCPALADQLTPEEVLKYELGTREDCLKMSAAYHGLIPLDDEIMARLNEAREYYNQYVDPSYVVPPVPRSCAIFQVRMHSDDYHVPCYFNELVMGANRTQAKVDLIRGFEEVRLRKEAVYSCAFAHNAANVMKQFGDYDLLVGDQ